MPEKKLVLSVKELNNYVKLLLEGDVNLSSCYVKGEISNFTNHYKSGHFYMSLKDEESAIRAVMFKGNTQKLKFMPKDGMKVIALGRVSVFARDGQYQFYIENMIPDGIGDLNLAYEQLKEKLASEGLFSLERKKKIPKIPSTVGVITAPTGAAIRDIINVLGRRFPMARVILYPVLVQGDGAPEQIATALKYFNQNPVDVIICGRGGGSLEDLWAFNDENVARTIASSNVPVISAVGHETDFTIADFVADLRAPTPSAAAELAVPDTAELITKFDNVSKRLELIVARDISNYREKLKRLSESQFLKNPQRYIDEKKLAADFIINKLENSSKLLFNKKSDSLGVLAAKLDALSPLSVLSRGFSFASKEGKVINSVKALKEGDSLNINLKDGNAQCIVERIECTNE
ncbi:MAG: exodeoxyribonuclease VII large subunit [Ruminococcaceae bacterium]|nr:exodeoxyribonuclease VII large subunit [Oscillospiraceae bacterium]